MSGYEKVFAERLRAVMGARRITMQALGDACGVTPQAVNKWCSGVAMPSSSSLLVICKVCGCSLEWLMATSPIDWESSDTAPQGRGAKYWGARGHRRPSRGGVAMSEQWGPWIEHPGGFVPSETRGAFYHLEFDDGDQFIGRDGVPGTSLRGADCVPSDDGWTWRYSFELGLGSYARVIRYRILQDIARDPEKVDA